MLAHHSPRADPQRSKPHRRFLHTFFAFVEPFPSVPRIFFVPVACSTPVSALVPLTLFNVASSLLHSRQRSPWPVNSEKEEFLTFFPGFRSTAPTTFSSAPSTLSLTVGFLFCFTSSASSPSPKISTFSAFAGRPRFSTRPPLTLDAVSTLVRGFEVLALGLPAPVFFLVMETVVVSAGLRGAVWPVAWRVRAIFRIWTLCVGEGVAGRVRLGRERCAMSVEIGF